MRIVDLTLRGVLDSRAKVTVECDLVVEDGARTVITSGSAPRAIAPGRRERRRSEKAHGLGRLPGGVVAESLRGIRVGGYAEVDDRLHRLLDDGLGSDISLAISLAASRAEAEFAGAPLFEIWNATVGESPRLPRLMVNLVSAGIHQAPAKPSSFQQVMALPCTGDLISDLDAALEVYGAALARASTAHREPRISASSGLLLDLEPAAALEFVAQAIDDAGVTGRCGLGVDVAGEHVVDGSGYRWGTRLLSIDDFADELLALCTDYRLEYL
ncbi:MAG: hypothetical protein ACRCYU_08370, partial [Nocardioides sp.]